MWRRCSGWCGRWRPNAPTSLKHRRRSNVSASSFRSCSAASLVRAPSGLTTTSCSLASKTSPPISRGLKQRFHQRRSGRQHPDRGPSGQACRRICPVKTWGSISISRPARAAAASFMPSARPSARCWTTCRHGFGSSASAGRAMAAGPAGPSTRRPAPERPIGKGLATPGLLAHVLVAKYCDYLPLYRQSQIFARQSVEIDRSTLANWVGGACWWLEPLQARLAEHVFASQKLFADDTPIPVLDPGRGRTKTGRLWVYARDDRPWSGADPPAAVYFYSPDRRAERPPSHLANFKGVLQVDGYPGFERLSDGGDIKLVACWSHTRRKFYEVHQATSSPIAAEALRRIAELYAIETAIRGQTAAARISVRQSKSLPLVTAMKAWLDAQLTLIPPRSGLADAIRYALIRWSALCSFLDDGRIELDTNTVERVIRPVALGRKNHLFAGSDGGGARWATVCSLITTAKLNEVEPFAYLKDVLERMSSGHPMSRLDDLLPWNWAPANAKT